MSDVTLTQEQRDKESAVLSAIVLDSLLLALYVLVGLFSGSLTFISEVFRAALLTLIEYVSYFVLRRTHRGEFREFEFGTGKIERIVNLLVAFGLCLACFYIFNKLFSIGKDTPIAAPNLVLAVILADMNLILNLYLTASFIRVNRGESSVIISSQIKSRQAKTVASAVVLGVLILTLWLPDPRSARIVDICGSIFVMGYMLVIALELVKESLPEILDRSVPEPEQYQIIRILTEHFEQFDGFNGYSTRRSGKDLFILLNLSYYPKTTLDQVEDRLAPLRRAFESELPGSKVTIIPELMEEV